MLSKLNFIQEKGVGDFFSLNFQVPLSRKSVWNNGHYKEATIVWAQGPSLEGMLE